MTSAILLSSTATAGPTDPVVVTATRDADQATRTVSYRDLNLVLASDQRRLDRRVGSAVKQVCAIDDYHAVRSLSSYAGYRECSNFAWNGARPQIAAAVARAQALALNGAGGNEVASTAIIISSRAGN